MPCFSVHPCSIALTSSHSFMSVLQLLSHTPMVLEFLLQQSETNFDGSVQQHERNRKILRCLLSWVRHYTDVSYGFLQFCHSAYYVALFLSFNHGSGQDIFCFGSRLSYINKNIHPSRASSKAFCHLEFILVWSQYVQVKAGCFSEISPGTLPAHPLLNFLFNSLQVFQFSCT